MIRGKYDVYYSTGGGSLVQGGADLWVNRWLENVAPRLSIKPVLLIHRRKPNNIRDIPIEHYWQGDDPKKFEEIANGARRINILHGYYTPHHIIENNKDKIHSVVIHVSMEQSLNAGIQLGLPTIMHFSASPQWEKEVVGWAKNVVWIGLDKTPLHDKYNIIDIPNFYEFEYNKDIVDSNIIGFTARMETRKAPHFIDDSDSVMFTSHKDVDNWRKKLGHQFAKTKIFNYKYENLNQFYEKDWGISHSCFVKEPFGYSIFQAIDHGKLPILHDDWCSEFTYPFRASTKEEFDLAVKRISNVDIKYRRKRLNLLRDYLRKYDNVELWTSKYLDIYND